MLLGDFHVPHHRLASVAVGELDPALPPFLLDSRIHRKRSHRAYYLHGARPKTVEVACEQGVRAAQLAGSALGAMYVVTCYVFNREMALLHRDDVGVKGGGRMCLVTSNLHDGTYLATKFMP
jgi:hypothetical protein